MDRFGRLVTAAFLVAAAVSMALAPAPEAAGRMAIGREATGVALDMLSLEGTRSYGPVEVTNPDDFGGEPGVDVAPDGTVYVNAPSAIGSGRGSWLYRRDPSGWTDCALTTGPGGGDSNVAINPWGRIAMNDLWLGSLTFYQDDKSRCGFWLVNPVSTPVPVGDRQWIDWGWSDCEYVQSWNQIPTGIHMQYTKDCGVTWTDAQVAPAMDLIGNLVVDHSGATRNVYQFYTSGGAVHVAVITIANGPLGTTISSVQRTVAAAVRDHNTAESFPVGDVDAAGNLHIVWQDLHTQGKGRDAVKTSTIRYATSATRGATWSAPVTISTGGSNVFPWIAAGGAGKAIAAWYQSPTSGDPNNVNGPWYVQTATTTNGGGSWSQERATATSVHNDVICTSGTGCSGDDRDLLDFFEVDIDASGFAVIAFAKDTDANGNGNGDPRNAFVRQTSGTSLL